MRVLGYFLLIYGFIIVVVGQATSKKTALHTLSQRRAELAAKETFTKNEVEAALLNTALSVDFHCRGSSIGPFSMIAGGILLDVAKRRKKGFTNAS
jgi:hypothetical protein